MAKKLSGWKTKGMNRDLSVSAFNPEFAFENINLRLATNEGNTTLSWVNEKGTQSIGLYTYTTPSGGSPGGYSPTTIEGVTIGTAVINNLLILFTTDLQSTSPLVQYDHIYRLTFINDGANNSMQVDALFGAYGTSSYHKSLGLQTDHPLETIVSYESEDIQKVYWTDGAKQPRIINVAPDNDDKITLYNETSFDFIPTLQLNETIKVKKILGGGGMFAPGVIQYAFTYYNKYRQESNIFHVTPLYYISYADRGASPEDKVDNAFRITVSNVDTNFDYLRIYSIQRTSINGVPICKRIQDIEISTLTNNTASYTDTGFSGDMVDPTELLYKGGNTIKVGTMEQKDNTLFMGDITTPRNEYPDPFIRNEQGVIQTRIALDPDTRTFYPTEVSTDSYEYSNQLTSYDDNQNKDNNVPCAGFKYGNYYRCGIQFQDATGKWSDPVYLEDLLIEDITHINQQTHATVIDKDNHPDISSHILPPDPTEHEINVTVQVINNCGENITIRNQAFFVVGNVALRVALVFNNATTVTLANGESQTFSAIVSDGTFHENEKFSTVERSQWIGMPNNVVLIDELGNKNTLILNSMPSGPTGRTLVEEDTYVMTCTEKVQPVPVPTGKITFPEVLNIFKKYIPRNVAENSQTWYYLLNAYNMADEEWESTTGLFAASNYEDVINYHIGSNDKYETNGTGYKAMQAWLMAMCLSELIPTSGSTGNIQTSLYQEAYTVVGGRNVPLYGNYTLRSDLMVVRLVAASIYAKNRSGYTFDQMDAMRSEIGGSVIDLPNKSISYFGYDHTNSPKGNIGYYLALNSIFPSAPGPFDSGNSSRSHPSEQPADLFLTGNETGAQNWWKDNYIWDKDIDYKVTSEYNLQAVNDYLSRTVKAVADDFDNTVRFFSEMTYYKYSTGGSITTQDQTIYNPRFTFIPGTSSDSFGSFDGIFSSRVTGKDLSNLATDPDEEDTDFSYFMGKMKYIGGYSRYTILDWQKGRRRPGQGVADGSARGSGSDYKLNFLDDSSIALLAGGATRYDAGGTPYNYYIDINANDNRTHTAKQKDANDTYYTDSNGNRRWDANELTSGTYHLGYDELYGNLYSTTYPSGHSAGVWSVAMFVTMFFPNQYKEIFKAAYDFSVSRTILRAHWNSDIIYGRVIGTMIVPIIQARTGCSSKSGIGYRAIFQNAYNMAVGGNEGITIRIHNSIDTREAIRFSGKFSMRVQGEEERMPLYLNAPEDTSDGYAHWTDNKYTIPYGGVREFHYTKLTKYAGRSSETVSLTKYYGKSFVTADEGTWPSGSSAVRLECYFYDRESGEYHTNAAMIHATPVSANNALIQSGGVYDIYVDLIHPNNTTFDIDYIEIPYSAGDTYKYVIA